MTLKKVVLICIWCFYNAFYNLFLDETKIMKIAKMQKAVDAKLKFKNPFAAASLFIH